ncbi:DUF3017 domain-containing protein [Nocardia puris]|nr:DUF3017 domain-containing protein [Nocardia puris]MBF6366687.1 DUF3017 domain-containing protein [Nocardia puris]MBF6461029.1 DUF3017 domain-containing protein [Nocardia puris]
MRGGTGLGWASARIGAVTDLDAPAGRNTGGGRAAHFLRCHLPMVVVSLVIVVAIVFVASDRWRRGALFFGGAALLAAAFRLCLPTVRVGLLAVRSKPFDVAALSLLGSSIVFLAATINTLGVG